MRRRGVLVVIALAACAVLAAVAVLVVRSLTTSEPARRLVLARSFLDAATSDMRKVADDAERSQLVYEIAPQYAMLGDFDRALRLAASCLDNNTRSSTYMFVSSIQAELGDRAGALASLRLARDAAVAARKCGKDEYYTWVGSVAIDFARLGDREEAEKTLGHIDDVEHKYSNLCSVAERLAEQGRISEARDAIPRIGHRFQRDLLRAGIAEVLALRGDAVGAHAAAEEVEDTNLRSSAYVSIAEAEAALEKTAERAYAYQKATDVAMQIPLDPPNPEVIGDDYPEANRDTALEHIATSQANGGDIAGARETVARIKTPWVKRDALITIARNLLSSGDRAAAARTLHEARAARSDEGDDHYAWQELSEALALAGEDATALEIVAARPPDGARDCGYLRVVRALAARGKTARAKEIVHFVADPRYRVWCLADIGAAQWRAGDQAGARRRFAEALAAAATVPSTVSDYSGDRAIAYESIAHRQSTVGDFDGLREWVPKLPDPRDRAWAWQGAACPIAYDHYDAEKTRLASARSAAR